jgi:cytochrome c peroxidase
VARAVRPNARATQEHKMKSKLFLIGSAVVLVVAIAFVALLALPRATWSSDDIAKLRNLWIGSLRPLPPDPSNKYADNPQAAALGHKLFFDTRLSSNGKVACATCHQPDKDFQDGLPQAKGVGTTPRRAMTIVGTAYSPWMFWDGRKDSQWAQALGPMESAVEHGGNRTLYAHLVAQYYRGEYEALFGPLPDVSRLPPSAGPVDDPAAHAAWEGMSAEVRAAVTRVYANMGKAIAAYDRKLMPGPSRFDAYVQAVLNNDAAAMQAAFSPDEVAGLRLFIGKGDCTKCHNGPLFTNNDFHNTGVPAAPANPQDTGRAKGAQQVRADEFNCLSAYSDAKPEQCAELKFMIAEGDKLVGEFKPPSLRNVAERGPYMNAGQFQTLQQVLDFYSRAPAAPVGHSELNPLNLSETEQAQLIAFLKTLSGSLATAQEWRSPP